MKYSESEEMYLETLLILKQKSSEVRSVDLANELGYSRPSVSRAVSLLQKKGFITVDKSGTLFFTEKGKEKAEDVYERHQVITRLLVSMGAERKLAEENACRIEHVISPELFETLKKFEETYKGE